jgi:3-methyladenine DNA glycosylase AlkD
VSPDAGLVAAVRAGLAAAANPAKAPAMQAYMKSAMPYRGVASPGQKQVFAQVLAAHPLTGRRVWQDTVRELWDGAAFREERYAAIALLADRRYAGYRDPGTMPLIEHLIVTGAWWDHVDTLATRTVGPLVRAYPAELVPLMLRWADDTDDRDSAGNLWRRRTAIIHQVGAKEATDTDLLVACVRPSLRSPEFFLRKAVGWALRDLAWTRPQWVQAYVREHADELSGLSRREALKNVGPGGAAPSPIGVTRE